MSPPVQPPSDLALTALVENADATLAGAAARAPEGALLRVSASDADPPGELACYPIDPIHPLDLLLGFVAPAHWWALGVSSCGRQHPFGGDGRPVRSAESPRVRITVLIDRSGQGTGLLRRGDELIAMPGPPDGTCGRRMPPGLGLGTAPPPSTTVGLWIRCWLDRLVDTVAGSGGAGGGGPGPPTWHDVARLHPASSVVTARWAGLDLRSRRRRAGRRHPGAGRRLAVGAPEGRPRGGRRSGAAARRPGGRVDGRRHVGSMAAGRVSLPRRPGRRGMQPAAAQPRRRGEAGRAGVGGRLGGRPRAPRRTGRMTPRNVRYITNSGLALVNFGWRSLAGAARQGRHDLR